MSAFDTFDSYLDGGYDDEPKHGDTGSPVAETTRVYRIEMPDGQGPWCGGENSRRWCDKLENMGCAELAMLNNEQMGVTEEAFRDAHGHGSYGCDSLDALAKWFPAPARKFLAAKGAKVVVYDIPAGAPELVVGHGEVIFSRPICQRVETLDVNTFAPEK